AGDLDAEAVAQTLAHELSHLAHRRAFGHELPPWLAEGLADAVGDSATTAGFLPLSDLDVVAGIRKRLCGGYEIRRTESLARLVDLDRSGFDRGSVSFDYEQSALLVRFLLLDPGLGPRFRAWLGVRAKLRSNAPGLPAALQVSWPELERRFASWLGCS
ncbi:MAG: hypothetical protein ABIV06_12540, partial [Thermoanaerobaculia bacterium]